MSSYGWIITEDHINTGDANKMNRRCPDDIKETLQRVQAGKESIPENGEEFRIYDGDGELYYSGILIGDDVTCFEPMDDFAVGSGCTEIKLKHKGTGAWETL